jgi:flagellar hook-associated protein 1 FlgK
MSLSAALTIGRSGLTASQIGIQVAGNNMANAGTVGYSRQTVGLAPIPGDRSTPGVSIGRGVFVTDVRRQIDIALQGRMWDATSNERSAQAQADILAQVESVLGELGDNDLSSALSSFFRTWSERGNQTKSSAVVVQQGEALSQFMQRVRGQLVDQRRQVDDQVGGALARADELLTTIAGANRAIAEAEVAGAAANSLRDQRDQAIAELSTLMDVTVVDQGQQGVDVLVGSTPVVLGGQSRGIGLKRQVVDGTVRVAVATTVDGAELTVRSGMVGGLLSGRPAAITDTIDTLDRLAGQLIFEVNKVHSTSFTPKRLASATSERGFTVAERALALNDPANTAMASLPFAARNGGIEVVVRETATNATRTVRIPIDLDGVTAAGVPGTTDDTSAQDIVDALAAIPGLVAGFTPDGRLDVRASTGFDFAFTSDTSDSLAALGINAYFSGDDAASIGVRKELTGDPLRLGTGRMRDGVYVENAGALAIAGLQDATLGGLDGRSATEFWRDTVTRIGSETSSTISAATASSVVRESLEGQLAAMSGVSIDEESVNLLNFQRQYQASARLISVVDELTQTLINLV